MPRVQEGKPAVSGRPVTPSNLQIGRPGLELCEPTLSPAARAIRSVAIQSGHEFSIGRGDVVLRQLTWPRMARISDFEGSRGLLLIAASSTASWAIVSWVSGPRP